MRTHTLGRVAMTLVLAGGAALPFASQAQDEPWLVRFDPAVQAALQPSLKRNSCGLALQVGFNYEFIKNTCFNVDVKKVQIRTDVSSFGAQVGTFKVDPWLVGVGIGRRF